MASPYDERTAALAALVSPAYRAAVNAEIKRVELEAKERREQAKSLDLSARALADVSFRDIDWPELVRLAFLEGASLRVGYTVEECAEAWPYSDSAKAILWDQYMDGKAAATTPSNS